MKKGFTLVELIAVIALLGIIGLISVTAVNYTVENQKFKAFKLSTTGLLNTVKNDMEADGFNVPRKYYFEDNELYLERDCDTYISFDGKLENTSGYIIINNDSKIEMYLKGEKYCSSKDYNSDPVYGKIEDGVCIIDDEEIIPDENMLERQELCIKEKR